MTSLTPTNVDTNCNMHIVNEQKCKIPKGGKILSTKSQMAAHMMKSYVLDRNFKTNMASSKMSTQPCQKFGEDLVNCTICFDNFKDAKVLPCLHSFCQSCISRHYEVYRLKNGNRLSCPTCRELLPMPQNGVVGLRNDNTIIKTKELLDQVSGRL